MCSQLICIKFFSDAKLVMTVCVICPPLPDILLLLSSWGLQAFVREKSKKGGETNCNHLHVRQCFIVCIYLCLFHFFFTFVWSLPKLYISLISVLRKLIECSLERHANFTNMKQIDNSEKSRFFFNSSTDWLEVVGNFIKHFLMWLPRFLLLCTLRGLQGYTLDLRW